MAINPSMLNDSDTLSATPPAGASVLDLKPNSDTQQTNVQGQSVAPTATQAGVNVAVDPQGDTRTPFEIKQDQQSVNTKFTSTPDEANDDNYIIGEHSGHRYEKVDNSLTGQLLTAAIAYGTTYYSTDGDIGRAVMASGSSVNEHLNVIHRQSQIQEMEKEGLNPLDIETFIKTGDKKDLTTNKGKWINIGNGMIANENTGEIRHVYDATKANKPNWKPYTKPDGTTGFYDANAATPPGADGVPGAAPSATPGAPTDTSNNGDDGSGNMDTHAAGATSPGAPDTTIGIHKNASGDLVVGTRGKGGSIVQTPATADQRKGYLADHPEQGGNKNTGSIYNDTVALRTTVDSLSDAQRKQVFSLINLAPDQVQNALTSTQDPQVREAYNLLNSYKGQLSAVGFHRFAVSTGNPAKSDADNAQAAKMAPQLDTTSYEQFNRTFGRSFDAMAETQGWDKDKFNKDVEGRKKEQPKQVSIPANHVSLLLQDPSPEAMAEFDEYYKQPGLAQQVINQHKGG